jgi:hypothetical protein
MELTAVDNGDDTGGLISLTDNVGTASVFVSRFTGTNASRAFVLAGTILNNGTLNLPALETGPYLAVAVNGAEIASPLGFRITDGSKALHYRMMEAVREYVMSLALPNVSEDPERHVLCKLPYRPDLELEVDAHHEVAIMYFPKPETYTPASNMEDQVAYSVQVLLVRNLGQNNFKGLADLLKDRQLLGQSLSVCPLPDLEEIHTVQVQPGVVVLPEHWSKKYDCSTIVFRGLSEQPAGIF